MSLLMTLGIWMQLCPTAMTAAAAGMPHPHSSAESATAKSLTEGLLLSSSSSSDKVLVPDEVKHQQVFFPKQSHRQQEDQHHRSSGLTEVERKTDQSEFHSSPSLTPVHAADFNELRGKYGYFPPSMFRDFMSDARERTFNTLYGSIDSKGMFHPANHLAHKQSSSSPLPIAPDSQSHHHNLFHSPPAPPAGTLSQGRIHSHTPSQYFDRNKMTPGSTYTPSYDHSNSGRESTLGSGSIREGNHRQIQIGETLSSASSRQERDGGNQRSLALMSHLMHHPHGFIPPQMMLMPPIHQFGHEMMPLMSPYHAPYPSMLPLHQLDHMYPYSRPLVPYMSPMLGYDGFGMMPPAYAGMGIGYPGMYHRSTADSPAPAGSHASQIQLSGGIYPPLRQPHDPRHLSAPSHSHASYPHPHLRPLPAHPHSLPSSPPRTLFPYSFQSTPGSAESRPDMASSSSSYKHDRHKGWIEEEDERGGSSQILPTRPRAVSEVREAYEKAMIHNASKLTASPFFP